jgi:hypothetical protein
MRQIGNSPDTFVMVCPNMISCINRLSWSKKRGCLIEVMEVSAHKIAHKITSYSRVKSRGGDTNRQRERRWYSIILICLQAIRKLFSNLAKIPVVIKDEKSEQTIFLEANLHIPKVGRNQFY